MLLITSHVNGEEPDPGCLSDHQKHNDDCARKDRTMTRHGEYDKCHRKFVVAVLVLCHAAPHPFNAGNAY